MHEILPHLVRPSTRLNRCEANEQIRACKAPQAYRGAEQDEHPEGLPVKVPFRVFLVRDA